MPKQSKRSSQNVDMEHLAAMLHRIAEGVFTVDADKRITFFNRAAERITGFSAKDAVGQPCRDVFRADVCGEQCILDEVQNTGKSVNDRRVTIVDSTGRSLALCVNAGALKDSTGRYVGGIETFRDVSTEEELRRKIEKSYTFHDIVSRHPRMHEIFAILPDIAASEVPVLIEGESGTGKELLARAIHNLSPRQDGHFRKDLYYRLNVLRLELPPLRERRSDIPLLVEHFRCRLNAEIGKTIERVDPAVFDVLMRHDFPGNIRELENIMQHAFVLCRGTVIETAHLPGELPSGERSQKQPVPLTLKSVEKRTIENALRDNAGNRSATAKQLGIDPSSLYRKMRRYGIR